MNVSHIRIRNVLGLESLDIEPGSVTVIEGDNGAGKTSALEAIRTVLSGGHDATLLRHGAAEGEVVIMLDDGTELWKRITPERSTLKVTDGNGKPVRAPQTWLKQLVDRLSINPIDFLFAKDKAAILSEVMPMPVTDRRAEQIADCVGDVLARDEQLLVGDYDNVLDAIDDVHKMVYDERTGHNRLAKSAKANAQRLAETIPDEIDDDAEAEVQFLRKQLEQAQGEQHSARVSVTATHDKEMASVRNTFLADKADAERQYQQTMANLQQTMDKAKHSALLVLKDRLSEISQEYSDTIGSLKARVAAAEERQKAADYHRRSAALLTEAEGELRHATDKSQACTAAIKELKDLKSDILNDLPIFGLSIRSGKVYMFDTPFERLNHSAQVQLAVEVARMRAGDIPLICVDGLESLDQKTFDAFVTAMVQAKLQAIITRVTDDKGLIVNTITTEQ